MKRLKAITKLFMLSALCLTSFLMIFNANAALEKGSKLVTKDDLGGEDRVLTYLSTDKPIYRGGETAYFRAISLDAETNFPLNNGLNVSLVIKGPKGEVILRSNAVVKDSVAGGSWKIPEGQSGGEYTATVSTSGGANAVRKFDIRAYQPPRLKSQIEFVKKGYGPGDKASATVNVKRAEGGLPVGAKVTAIARVDGVEVYRNNKLIIDSDGNCSAQFELPEEIAIGDGTLSFLIEDGGTVETASKTIPILLQTMDIKFYPEGGALVSGINNRIYIQANRPDGKPADIQGTIVETDKDSNNILRTLKNDVQTTHEGRGRFSFVPSEGKNYALVLSKPSGITKHFDMPKVEDEGAIISSAKNVYSFEDEIELFIDSSKHSKVKKVTLNKRDVVLDSKQIKAEGRVQVKLDAKEAEGVLMATVWGEDNKPLAERLIFRKPKFAVNIKITPEADEYVPGGKVKLNIETTNANGDPVEAVVGITVTDDAVLEMIDKREQAPRLPVMVYLENEVKDLADAHIYFDENNPDAAQNIDLLLGTQGWRRFILVRFDELLKTDAEAAKRAMAMMPLYHPPVPGAVRLRNIGKGVFWGGDANVEGFMAQPEVGDEIDAVQPMVVGAKNDKKDFKENVVAAPRRQEIAEEVVVRDIAAKDVIAKDVIAKVIAPKEKAAFDRFEPLVEREQKKLKRRIAVDYVVIREYAHKVRNNRRANDRIDFTETLYWNAGVKTSPRSGKASVEFVLSDSITTFKVLADAFGNNGALGEKITQIESLEPYYLEPKLPQEVTVGDVISLPVTLVNSTNKQLNNANLVVRGEGLEITQVKPVNLQPKQRSRRIVKITAKKPGVYNLVISSAASGYTDTVTRKLTFKAKGFPMAISAGGLIGPDMSGVKKITIPKQFEIGSLITEVKIYPTPLANMEEALNALLRQPYGCFEQTSSTNYPLVMAQQYFTTHQGVAPEKIRKTRDLMEKGYKRLIGFESKKKGYEWFGGDPAHEALTAYGLLEFSDMSKLMSVDNAMIDRTKEWLLSRRDGKGGFKRNERALDSFGRAPAPTTNAYILWTLLESGESPAKLKKEIEAVKKDALTTKDSYVVALAANILYLSGDIATADKLNKKLSASILKNGSIQGGVTTITNSGGQSLEIETTSLAILAFLKGGGKFAAEVETTMKWLFEACKAGKFGSTQSTVLALKAINAYDKARSKPKAPGTAQLVIDGVPFGNVVKFDAKTKGAIELPDFAAALTSGKHIIEVIMKGGSEMPYSLNVKYNTQLPPSADKTNLKLAVKLSTTKVAEGEPLEATVDLEVLDKDAPTPIAIIGIPAGLEPRHDQLKELVSAKRIDSYEVIGRNIVLYWRALKAKTKVQIPLSLTAKVPGKYTAPASRAYLYYTDEYKYWQQGMAVEVMAK